jgi:hypothetical protein
VDCACSKNSVDFGAASIKSEKYHSMIAAPRRFVKLFVFFFKKQAFLKILLDGSACIDLG